MDRSDILEFLRQNRLGVVATVGPQGEPQAAVMGLAVTPQLELVFDTLASTRKVANLRRDGRVAVAVGWSDERTVQLQGVADEPTGEELERIREAYFAAFPDGRERLRWEGILHVRVRPTWIRFTDYRGVAPQVFELVP